jgi:hypothetical protein
MTSTTEELDRHRATLSAVMIRSMQDTHELLMQLLTLQDGGIPPEFHEASQLMIRILKERLLD